MNYTTASKEFFIGLADKILARAVKYDYYFSLIITINSLFDN